jgi:hypothetical protein
MKQHIDVSYAICAAMPQNSINGRECTKPGDSRLGLGLLAVKPVFKKVVMKENSVQISCNYGDK